MSSRPCGTCSKPVYPKEKTAISNIWVHAKGCLKCSLCASTLALTSVYVGLDSVSGEKRLFRKTDVPRTIHHAVVDSIALRHALSTPKADQPGAGGRLGSGKVGSMRFKGLTLRSKSIAGGLNAPKILGDGSRNKIIIGTVHGATLDSWDIAAAISAQTKASSPLSSFPAIKAQLTGTTEGSFISPSILVPQLTGSNQLALDHVGQSETHEDNEIAREEKGGKETPSIEAGLVKNLLRAFQLEEVREVKLPAGHVRAPTPFALRGKQTEVPSPLGADDGVLDETRFLSIKPSVIALKTSETSDVVEFRTLGTRRNKFTSLRRTPALKSLFDPPTAVEGGSPAKHVKISSGPPSLISQFSGGELLPARAGSPGYFTDEDEDADDEAEDMDDETFAEAMEGLELVLVYEEEPEIRAADNSFVIGDRE